MHDPGMTVPRGRAFWREPGIHTHGALGPWAIRASLVFSRMRQAASAGVVMDSGPGPSGHPGM